MGQMSVGRLHGRLDVLQTSFPPSPSWIQDGEAGNDVIHDRGRVFRSPLRRRRKMAALPLPAAILDDLICGTGNEVIQDGGRKRKGRHLAPPPQWGSKNAPYTTYRLQCSIYAWEGLEYINTIHASPCLLWLDIGRCYPYPPVCIHSFQ